MHSNIRSCKLVIAMLFAGMNLYSGIPLLSPAVARADEQVPVLPFDDSLRQAALQTGTALGLNPIVVYKTAEGRIAICQGSKFTQENGRWKVSEGDMLINAGEQPISAFGATIAKGEAGQMRNGRFVKFEKPVVPAAVTTEPIEASENVAPASATQSEDTATETPAAEPHAEVVPQALPEASTAVLQWQVGGIRMEPVKGQFALPGGVASVRPPEGYWLAKVEFDLTAISADDEATKKLIALRGPVALTVNERDALIGRYRIFDANLLTLVTGEQRPVRVAWVVQPLAAINVSELGYMWTHAPHEESWRATSQVLMGDDAPKRFIGLLEVDRPTKVTALFNIPASHQLDTYKFHFDGVATQQSDKLTSN